MAESVFDLMDDEIKGEMRSEWTLAERGEPRDQFEMNATRGRLARLALGYGMSVRQVAVFFDEHPDYVCRRLMPTATPDQVMEAERLIMDSTMGATAIAVATKLTAKQVQHLADAMNVKLAVTVVPDGTKAQVLAMRLLGASYGAIARELQIPRSTVSSYCLRSFVGAA